MPLLSALEPSANCSCLYFWLIQNYPYYVDYLHNANYLDYSSYYNYIYSNCEAQNQLFAQQCWNKSKGWMKSCNIDSSTSYQNLDQSNEKSDYEIQFSFYTAKYFISIIFAPLICISGFLLNAFTI
jgi:hypothetical protein